ncbi:MAG: hypothetical protein HOU01_21305 [Streptomycetaceae bacterium]|nr:hypothetical protein [Streptomycetaceae bacterium]
MARYNAQVTSAAALAVDTAFAALVPAAAVACKLRRVTLGISVSSGSITSQQVVVAINRGTARGTATTTVTGQRLDPRSAASAITGLDTVWSVAPTLAAADAFRVAFNSQSGVDLPWELMEEFLSDVGTANPLVFVNRVTALPANHSLVLAVEYEE